MDKNMNKNISEIEYYTVCNDLQKILKEESNNFGISEMQVNEVFITLLSDEFELMYCGNEDIINCVKICYVIFKRVVKIKNYTSIISVIKYLFFDKTNLLHL